MDLFSELAVQIIKQQENVIGPLALEQAKKVQGLTIDWNKKSASIEGNKKDVLEHLIEQYKYLFGQTSVEVCKNAVKNIVGKVPADQLPPLLQ